MLLQLTDALLSEHGVFLLLGVVFSSLGVEALVNGATGLALIAFTVAAIAVIAAAK